MICTDTRKTGSDKQSKLAGNPPTGTPIGNIGRLQAPDAVHKRLYFVEKICFNPGLILLVLPAEVAQKAHALVEEIKGYESELNGQLALQRASKTGPEEYYTIPWDNPFLLGKLYLELSALICFDPGKSEWKYPRVHYEVPAGAQRTFTIGDLLTEADLQSLIKR